jgi:dUTP pyrophosphatase
MKVRIKKLHENAVIPSYSKKGDAGMDLTAVEKYYDVHGCVVYRTGIAIEIPEGYVGMVFPRSSICKQDLTLINSVGIIDSGYRGEIIMKFKPALMFVSDEEGLISDENDTFMCADGVEIPWDDRIPISALDYEVGDRIAQLIIMPYPHIEFEEVEELTETERGDGGYGSTGR